MPAPLASAFEASCEGWFNFEAITFTIQSIAQHATGSAEEGGAPPQERDRRLCDQRKRLSGLLIKHATEPAHMLVDKFVKMAHDACLAYVPLSACASREDEMSCAKPDKKLLSMEHNKIVFKAKEPAVRVDLGSEMRVHQALLRRALAADQAGLISFSVLDTIHQEFLAHLSRPTPPVFDPPSIQSLLRAGQQLWKLVADSVGSNIQQDETGQKPLDVAFKKFCHDGSVVFYLLPTHSVTKPRKDPKKRQVDEGEAEFAEAPGGKKRKDDKGPMRMPKALQGLPSKNRNGVPFCFNFKEASGGPCRCRRGLHQCMKCFKPHGQHKCAAA